MTKQAVRKIRSFMELATPLVVACGLMLWGAFNSWTNLLAFNASEDEEANWKVAIVLTIVTSVVPFLIGLGLLIRATGKKKFER